MRLLAIASTTRSPTTRPPPTTSPATSTTRLPTTAASPSSAAPPTTPPSPATATSLSTPHPAAAPGTTTVAMRRMHRTMPPRASSPTTTTQSITSTASTPTRTSSTATSPCRRTTRRSATGTFAVQVQAPECLRQRAHAGRSHVNPLSVSLLDCTHRYDLEDKYSSYKDNKSAYEQLRDKLESKAAVDELKGLYDGLKKMFDELKNTISDQEKKEQVRSLRSLRVLMDAALDSGMLALYKIQAADASASRTQRNTASVHMSLTMSSVCRTVLSTHHHPKTTLLALHLRSGSTRLRRSCARRQRRRRSMRSECIHITIFAEL